MRFCWYCGRKFEAKWVKDKDDWLKCECPHCGTTNWDLSEHAFVRPKHKRGER